MGRDDAVLDGEVARFPGGVPCGIDRRGCPRRTPCATGILLVLLRGEVVAMAGQPALPER